VAGDCKTALAIVCSIGDQFKGDEKMEGLEGR
jgi:hypothetical protein